MATPIYNHKQQTIGFFEERNGGHMTAILNRQQVTLGYYQKNIDTTFDRQMRTIGKGNQLMMFLMLG